MAQRAVVSPIHRGHQPWDVAFKKEAEPQSVLATGFGHKWLLAVPETCTFNSRSCLLCMDEASPRMAGIAAVHPCDDKEQLCTREPYALAFLCVGLSAPLQVTLPQRWVSLE